MARQEGKFLKGLVGPVNFREYRGQQIVSAKVAAGRIKQTEATKRSNVLFGKASSLGASIRKLFDINKGAYEDGTVLSRLTGKIREVLSLCEDEETESLKLSTENFQGLVGFNFNDNAKMEKILYFKPLASMKDGMLTLDFDEINVNERVSFPSKSSRCLVTLDLASFNLNEGSRLEDVQSRNFEFTKVKKLVPAQSFTFNLPAGCLSVVKMSAQFSVATKAVWKTVTDIKANPSAICAAVIAPGTFKKNKSDHWRTDLKFKMTWPEIKL